jgi:surface protein
MDPLTDANIRAALASWYSDPESAVATYGYISTWDVSGVFGHSERFCGSFVCRSSVDVFASQAFNDNISSWDTSSTTNMRSMFRNALAFNGDISSWDVTSVHVEGIAFGKLVTGHCCGRGGGGGILFK